MASKYKLVHSNLYYENTDVPQNRFDIKDSKVIHQLENEFLEKSYTEFLDLLNNNTIFDESYFKLLHKNTFEKLYEWAGEYRIFNMAKGESRFCQGAYIDNEAKRIFNKLRQDNYLKNCRDKEEFVKKMAYYKCELIALHPFPELNGRITRMFFDMMAYNNGYEFIDYSQYKNGKYIEASIKCVQYANEKEIEKIISNGLRERINAN